MAPPPIADQKTLSTLGISLSPRTVLILEIVVPILAVVGAAVGAYLLARWQAKKKTEAPPPLDASAGGAPPSQIAPNQLRTAWVRFASQLPGIYRRSVLNFEHFVVLGAAAAGKSKLIDANTDWRRQAKQFLGSQSYDPDLQVYLSSWAIVTEIPARILADASERCQHALRNLWKPLYRSRAPTVVVVVDAIRLRESTADAVADLAETIRGKVNLLGAIRRRRIEVRVAVTHLDEIEGFSEFARFCREQGLSTRIPFAPDDLGVDLKTQLEGWFEVARSHIPRALTKLSADDFRKVVGFLRKAPEIVPSLAQFLGTLFAHEGAFRDPVPGGVYLSSDPPGVANPLRSGAEVGPGPDPRRKHQLIAVAVASACLAYLAAAYREQRALWVPARDAIGAYKPTTSGNQLERMRRTAITSFTQPSAGALLLRRPDFFARSRVEMRKAFSDKIREGLLEPRLKEVATSGIVQEGQIPLRRRRSLYFLGLVHSDKRDFMKILEPHRLEVWSQMTGIEEDLVEDYLRNTDQAYPWPVAFDFPTHDVEALDSPATWAAFLRELDAEISDGVIRPADLRGFQARADQLLAALSRFDDDDITLGILDQLDAAAQLEGGEQMEAQLHGAYAPRYAEWLRDVKSADMFAQREQMRRIFRVVRTGAIEVKDPGLLRGVVDRIGLLYGVGEAPVDDKPIALKLGGQEYSFDPKRWRELIRDSTATEQIAQFIRLKSNDGSIFFSHEDEAEVRPVIWNPTGGGATQFVGRGILDGKYTKEAYDRYVKDVVGKLAEVLDKAKIPDDQRRQLTEFVREQVRRYATEYKNQLFNFVKGFSVSAPTAETLRTVLAQMSSDGSAFDDFLNDVDRNANVEVNGPLLEPMRDVVNEYAAWHGVVDAGGGAPELKKYKAILATLLTDLSQQGGDATAPPDPNAQANETLEKALTPAGRVVLQNARGEKGSYAKLVGDWLSAEHLAPNQEPPFLSPLTALNALGRNDINTVVRNVWEIQMVPDLLKLVQEFPFDREGKEEVTPKELTTLFHPQNGKFFDLFRRYIEPISDIVDGAGFRQKAATRATVNVPSDLYPVTNAVAMLSSRLFDPTGKPLPFVVRVQTVPFPHGPNPSLALTLMYMNVGDQSVFNFNQQPATTFLNVDWTKEATSQVGVQLTDLDTKENTFPEPVVAPTSFWSFLHLLRRGTSAPVRQPAGALVYTWNVKIRRDAQDTMPARFVVLDDMFDKFVLGKLLKNRLPKGVVPSDG